MNFILWLTLPCYFFSLLISCDAVHFDHVEETHQCVLPPVVGADDLAWTDKVTTNWYIPMWDSVVLYETVQLIFGPKKLHASSSKYLVEKACPNYIVEGSHEIWTVFGRKLVYDIYPNPVRPAVTIYTTADKANDNKQEYIVTAYTTLTDRATYLFVMAYWADGQKGFVVASPDKKLSNKALKEVRSHARALGFNPNFFVYTNYDKC